MTSFIGANVTNTYTSTVLQQSGVGYATGDRYVDSSGNEFVFVKAAATFTAAGVVVQIVASTGIATMLTSALAIIGQKVGVAMSAPNTNEFGWVQIYGDCTSPGVQASAASVITVQPRTTATAGNLSATISAGTTFLLHGIGWLAAPSGAGLFAGNLNYPVIGTKD